MSIYYVSAQGCDTNDGLSKDSALKSVAKVNSLLESGDEVRFRAGDVFYGGLRPPRGISENERTTVTRYGEGKNPVISQYKKANVGAWELHSDDIYKIDLTNIENFTGNTQNIDTRVGFIKISGKIYHRLCKSLEELKNEFDFFCDDRYLYLKLFQSPDSYSDDFLFACNIKMIAPTDFLMIDSVDFCGTGGHGFQGVSSGSIIRNCAFCEIGGSFMLDARGNPTTIRYGNGVEFWTGSHDNLVENCHFADIYDVAMSIQGCDAVTNWENIVFRNNKTYNCTQSFEIWTKTEKEHNGIVNCYFENNTCINSGYGWGHLARPDKDQSCHLLIYHRECEYCDIHVKNNTFVNAKNSVIFKTGGAKDIPHDYKVYDNLFIHDMKKSLVFRMAGTNEKDYELYEKELLKNNTFRNINDFQK